MRKEIVPSGARVPGYELLLSLFFGNRPACLTTFAWMLTTTVYTCAVKIWPSAQSSESFFYGSFRIPRATSNSNSSKATFSICIL